MRFKTGDPHPRLTLLRFVEYDDNGIGWWTTIARDPEAPFRLANLADGNKTK